MKLNCRLLSWYVLDTVHYYTLVRKKYAFLLEEYFVKPVKKSTSQHFWYKKGCMTTIMPEWSSLIRFSVKSIFEQVWANIFSFLLSFCFHGKLHAHCTQCGNLRIVPPRFFFFCKNFAKSTFSLKNYTLYQFDETFFKWGKFLKLPHCDACSYNQSHFRHFS